MLKVLKILHFFLLSFLLLLFIIGSDVSPSRALFMQIQNSDTEPKQLTALWPKTSRQRLSLVLVTEQLMDTGFMPSTLKVASQRKKKLFFVLFFGCILCFI